MFLSATDKQSITARVAALERATGVEVVTLVTAKSDTYPEAVWKAFALGASLTALVVAVGEVLHPEWVSTSAVLSAAVTILGVGAACALATVYVPAIARLFVRPSRAAVETLQLARARFLERGLFATRERTAVLLLVSLLERRVVIVADVGLDASVSREEWDAVIAEVTPRLRDGQVGPAVLAGLAAMETLLKGKGIARGSGNAFADGPLEEAGP
jgi:putative membrane protein